MTIHGRFSQFDEDGYRLPEGMRRIAYDADTQCYTFCDRSGQLYESAPGAVYGVLEPVATSLSHRRNVTITETHDPELRRWSAKPAKTFNDILPAGYITPAQSGSTTTTPVSPTRAVRFSSEKFVQAAMPKVRGVVEIVRRRTTIGRSARHGSGVGMGVARSESVAEEKRRLLEEDWEVVSREEVRDARLARSKSEMRPPRYYGRK